MPRKSASRSKVPPVKIVQADLARPEHRRAVVEMIDAYATDPMGSGKPLPAKVRRTLIPGLRRHPTTLILLAQQGGKAIGIAVCFRGFSTFAARPLINIHDLAVLPAHRGQGIGRRLLEAVARKARATGCCKVTLEVLEKNHKARRVYEAAGFSHAHYRRETGGSLFFAKAL